MADRLGLDLVLNWMEQLQEVFGPRYAPAPDPPLCPGAPPGVKTRLGFWPTLKMMPSSPKAKVHSKVNRRIDHEHFRSKLRFFLS